MASSCCPKPFRTIDIYNLTKENWHKVDYLYQAMSQEQRAAATKVPFLPKPPPPGKKSPSVAQLKAWQNPAVYGVWLDGKRIRNKELSKYQPKDFALYSVSRLAKNAINYGKHYYQVDLDTPQSYEAIYKNFVPPTIRPD